MDTHPRDWPQGTRIFFIGEGSFPFDPTARTMAEVVDYKVTMQTSLGTTTVDEVPVTSLLMLGRQGSPYPVANVTVGGTYWPASVTVTSNALNVSWSTRNRLLQNGAFQVRWDEPSVTPEDGATVLVFAMQGDEVVSSVHITDPTTNTAILPLDGVNNGVTTVYVRTLRDGLTNYQDYQHTLDLDGIVPTGWGESWGS